MIPRGRWWFEPWPALYPCVLWDVEELFRLDLASPVYWVYLERAKAVLAEIWQLQALEEL